MQQRCYSPSRAATSRRGPTPEANIKCKCPTSHPIGIKRDKDFPNCSFLMNENCAMRTSAAVCLPSGAIGVRVVRYASPDAAPSRKGYESDCIVSAGLRCGIGKNGG